MLDFSTPFGARVAKRLHAEAIIWLTTVRADGAPLPSPVWFLYEDATLLIYSKPATPKLRNSTARPLVALNFNSDSHGGDVVILSGTAVVDSATAPAHQHAAYLEKYRSGIASIGMTPESFAAAYSVALRVTLTGMRGH